MASPIHIPLGAPGIYHVPTSPLHALTGVRMDVCAFVGVAPRGPVRAPVFNEEWQDDGPCVEPERPRRRSVPVAVEDFNEYRRLFGGFEGPGLLPYSVAAFFEQGGRRAYIVRIVHDYRDPLAPAKPDPVKNAGGVAWGVVPLESTNHVLLRLGARNEGSWGNLLRASLNFATRPLDFEPTGSVTSITVADGSELPPGTLLRLTLDDATRALRLVETVTRERRDDRSGFRKVGIFNFALPTKVKSAEVVEGVLALDDGDGRFERHERLGFSKHHPRWMATVLCYESSLVYPAASWIDDAFIPTDLDLLPIASSSFFSGGEDRYHEIEPADFFSDWVLGNDEPGDGVHALVQLSDLSSVVVPDLYSPAPLSPSKDVADPASHAGPEFGPCVTTAKPEQTKKEIDLKKLRLDPRLPEDLKKIIGLQKELVDLADRLHSFIVLLDVPPGLSQRQILTWRTKFDSAFAAAYHPWLQTSRNDDERELLRVPPAAVAAGIIARQEISFGVPTGPANVLATQIVNVDDVVSPERHDELHPEGVNVYLRERDGIRLTAARTISRDPQWRQLSVRRLVTMIERAIEQQMQWVVFEPNNKTLRTQVRLALQSYLRQLFRLGAFRGATEDEAFFVRCDDTNNPPYVADAGRLIVEIGVAPAEPLEFIVLQLTRGGDGTLTLEEK
ncbi:MAG TPA: phage tail sheath C-terminal domain-containing protein [Pyrinomonadaceae bacterium]|nr:phage tail sheath C-terminal domain-containing protein [Pyrinomonadaceae bacterium]